MEMLKGFPIQKYLDKKPPNENSVTTKGEVKELSKLPIREKFIKEKDDIKKSFESIVGKDEIIQKLINESAPIIMKIKKHHNRPRPKVMAKKMKTKMEDMEMASMKTPSYPSGHSTQGILIAKVLGDKHPAAKQAFAKTGKNISYSRRVAHAHYKSDSDMGEKLGAAMYDHIKK